MQKEKFLKQKVEERTAYETSLKKKLQENIMKQQEEMELKILKMKKMEEGTKKVYNIKKEY